MKFLYFSESYEPDDVGKDGDKLGDEDGNMYYFTNVSNICQIAKGKYDGTYKVGIITIESSRPLVLRFDRATEVITNCKAIYNFLNFDGLPIKYVEDLVEEDEEGGEDDWGVIF